MTEVPLSLYIHLPWCVKKCPYCDFNSYRAGENVPKKRYINALLCDMRQQASRAEGREIQTIFLGGGTPSLFSSGEVCQILDATKNYFCIAKNAEITMEENPGTTEHDSPKGYLDAGITRLSIGAQSFSDDSLKSLGRIHSSKDISRAFLSAKEAGFKNINIDLMYGLPNQTLSAAMSDLKKTVEFHPTHISWYQLTLEPKTVFHAKPPNGLPDDEVISDIQENGQRLLESYGYKQYEVSAYAKGKNRCQHNLNYWSFGDYIAIGAGAHGKITISSKIYRYEKPSNPLEYMMRQEAQEPKDDLKCLEKNDLIFEFMLNALRLNDGFTENLFTNRTGLSSLELRKVTAGVRSKGLIEQYDNKFWRPTDLGRRFLNDLQSEFIPNQTKS